MTDFPKIEADISLLAKTIINGIKDNHTTFPHVDVAALESALNDYMTAKHNQINARANFGEVSNLKSTALEHLKEVIHQQLNTAEKDTLSDPGKLRLIGWESSDENSVEIPGPPENLIFIVNGFTMVTLNWQAPQNSSAVRAYLIYRNDVGLDGVLLQDWTLVATSLKLELKLNKQPQNMQLNYRVTAINLAGESVPSNIIEVVLR